MGRGKNHCRKRGEYFDIAFFIAVKNRTNDYKVYRKSKAKKREGERESQYHTLHYTGLKRINTYTHTHRRKEDLEQFAFKKYIVDIFWLVAINYTHTKKHKTL